MSRDLPGARFWLRSVIHLVLCICIATSAANALAQSYPARMVRITVGFAPGGSMDVTARLVAERLKDTLGQQIVVENRPGANGVIAADLVAKSTDDHTLGVVINGNLTSAKMLNPQLGYDPARDFSFLSLLTTAPLALVASTPCTPMSGRGGPARGRTSITGATMAVCPRARSIAASASESSRGLVTSSRMIDLRSEGGQQFARLIADFMRGVAPRRIGGGPRRFA